MQTEASGNSHNSWPDRSCKATKELAEDQRAAGKKAQQLAETGTWRKWTHEPGNRTGTPRFWKKLGQRAGLDLEIQVRIPGQQVTRRCARR